MGWKPGETGNPNGRPKSDKIWKAALTRAIKRRETTNPQAMDDLAEKFLKAMDRGDMSAFKEFGDRMDGKVPTPVVGDNDHPSVIDPRTFFAWMKDTAQGSNSLATIDDSSDLPRSSPIDAPEKPSLQ